MEKTTYTVRYTTADGRTITGTRTSHHPYTHAAYYDLGGGHEFFSFHGSEDLARKGSEGRKPEAIIKISDGSVTYLAAKTDICNGLPKQGQGPRLYKMCAECNYEGSTRPWRKRHTRKS